MTISKKPEWENFDNTYKVIASYLGSALIVGANATFNCPFHDDSTPSLKLYKYSKDSSKARWKCHGCGANGNVYEFIKKKTGINSFSLLVEKVSAILEGKESDSLIVPIISKKSSTETDKNKIAEICTAFIDHIKTISSSGTKYLKSRGLDPELCLKIGFRSFSKQNGASIQVFMESKFSTSSLIECGILSKNNKLRFYNRLLIPYYEGGKVAGIQGREILKNSTVLNEKGELIEWPKIINTCYIPAFWCGAERIPAKENILVICEGSIDSASAIQLGFRSTAVKSATVSAQDLKKLARIIKKANPDKIILATDQDKAGKLLRCRLVAALNDEGVKTFYDWVAPPGINDLNQLLQNKLLFNFVSS